MMLPRPPTRSRALGGLLSGLNLLRGDKKQGRREGLGRGVWAHFLGCSALAEKTPLPGTRDAKNFSLLSFQIFQWGRTLWVNGLAFCFLNPEPSSHLRRKVLGGAKPGVSAARLPTVSSGLAPHPPPAADVRAVGGTYSGDQLVRGGRVTLGELHLLAQRP